MKIVSEDACNNSMNSFLTLHLRFSAEYLPSHLTISGLMVNKMQNNVRLEIQTKQKIDIETKQVHRLNKSNL